MIRLPLLLLALAAAGCVRDDRAAVADSAAAAAGLDAELAGLMPRGTSACVNLFQSQQVRAHGATIVYAVSRGLKYRSDTTGGCGGIARGDILVTRPTTTQLCQGDIATTIDPVSRMVTGSCTFGSFTRYTTP